MLKNMNSYEQVNPKQGSVSLYEWLRYSINVTTAFINVTAALFHKCNSSLHKCNSTNIESNPIRM